MRYLVYVQPGLTWVHIRVTIPGRETYPAHTRLDYTRDTRGDRGCALGPVALNFLPPPFLDVLVLSHSPDATMISLESVNADTNRSLNCREVTSGVL